MVLVFALVIFAWWLGKPGNPPPIPIALSDINVTIPKVLGSETDKMPPISRFDPQITQAQKGDTVAGSASDLGAGVFQVVIQIQKVADGSVWNGENWSDDVGETLSAELTGLKFKFAVPVELMVRQRYILRSQAIDGAGNAQTEWSDMIVTGSEVASSI